MYRNNLLQILMSHNYLLFKDCA